MESYYVINNKIPNFFIKDYQDKNGEYLGQIKSAYQIWIKEKIISNLERRKANFFLFEFAKYLNQSDTYLEHVQKRDYDLWVQNRKPKIRIDFIEFLVYVREKAPGVQWSKLIVNN